MHATMTNQPKNSIPADAFTQFLQRENISLSPAELKKYQDFEPEPVKLSTSLFGGVFSTFKKVFQEEGLVGGLKKLWPAKGGSWADPASPYGAFRADYERFDALANHYGDLYRSSFVFNYFMGSLAVLAALIPVGFGFEHMDPHLAHIATPAMTVFELVVILTIYFIYKRGATPHGGHAHGHSGKRWHQRWLEYRLLAERFRYMELMYPLGLDPRASGVANQRNHDWSWTDAYFSYRLASTPVVENVDKAAIDDRLRYMIEDQMNYHTNNAKRMEHIHHKLHTYASGLFFLTFLACVAHLFWHNAILTLFAGFFPALAASCHGIIANGEFTKNEDISEKMAHELAAVQAQAEHIETDEQRREVVTTLHNLVINDALGWRAIFKDKNVPLA